jgi:acyl-CoA synthetase (AMP-forming)/AMP-acid ligase II
VQVVPDMLVNAVSRFGEQVCVSEGGRTSSFRETSDRASRLAAVLKAEGLQPGDRVALLAMNELEYTEIQVGCQRAGVTLVPLNYRLAVPELAYMVGDSTPSFLIHGPGFAEHAGQLGVAKTMHLGSEGQGDRPKRALQDQHTRHARHIASVV